MLSFNDVVSAHIISALRVRHHISMQRVRNAIDYVSREMKTKHPLLEANFLTDGADIFVERVEGMVNASQRGQMAIKPVLAAYLERIEYDEKGVARLFPFIRRHDAASPVALSGEPRFVVMDPRVSFGRPVLAGTNLRTSAIAERYMAGESIRTLAEDYHRPPEEIEEAIRCESVAA